MNDNPSIMIDMEEKRIRNAYEALNNEEYLVQIRQELDKCPEREEVMLRTRWYRTGSAIRPTAAGPTVSDSRLATRRWRYGNPLHFCFGFPIFAIEQVWTPQYFESAKRVRLYRAWLALFFMEGECPETKKTRIHHQHIVWERNDRDCKAKI